MHELVFIYSFFYFLLITTPVHCSIKTHKTRCKESEESETDQVNKTKDDSNLDSGEGNSNDQEESSMWQKCPVITFQTFDDLTGLFFIGLLLPQML